MDRNGSERPPLIMERIGKLNESDHRILAAQGSTAIFAAAWEMVVETYGWKKKSDSELAFQRTVERLETGRR